MWYILGGLVLLGAFAALTGAVSGRRRRDGVDRAGEPAAGKTAAAAGCCGQHAVCERDGLQAAAGREVEYYDDEELDAYRGVGADAYREEAVEEFREVLYTLKNGEAAGWIRSLQLRGIELPEGLRDEALLIAGEKRM
ncbi:MAG: phospholipase [Tannerella sp.]|jgi:hypothetical protein|nr:phospholipase [Tannerella sp.]